MLVLLKQSLCPGTFASSPWVFAIAEQCGSQQPPLAALPLASALTHEELRIVPVALWSKAVAGNSSYSCVSHSKGSCHLDAVGAKVAMASLEVAFSPSHNENLTPLLDCSCRPLTLQWDSCQQVAAWQL